MEHIFPPKVITLADNVSGTLTWGAVDIGQRFAESIIKAPNIAIRFSCSTTAGNAVNCGVRYETLTKSYRVSERQTLFQIPANGSAEVTPASKPALGQLNTGITSISVDLVSLIGGTTTIILIVDDDPPPLSSDPGQLLGLDARLALDYVQVNYSSGAVQPPGVTNFTAYTVPAGNRFFIDIIAIELEPTPSFPGTLNLQTNIVINGVNALFTTYSETDRYVIRVIPTIPTPLNAGDFIAFTINNNDTTGHFTHVNIVGRQVF